MHKAVARKTSIFLTGFILLAWMAIVPPTLSVAGMHELSDVQMSQVYGTGFSSFTLYNDGTNDIVKLDFSGVTLSTYTSIDSMKMGYYTRTYLPGPITTTTWDNDWTNVSLGTSSTDLVATGLYIVAAFSGDITNPATRQLEYVRLGTPNLTGTVTADFNRFSGTLDNGVTTFTRDNTFGTAAITSSGAGFNLTLSRNGVGNQMGYSFNWVNATKTP